MGSPPRPGERKFSSRKQDEIGGGGGRTRTSNCDRTSLNLCSTPSSSYCSEKPKYTYTAAHERPDTMTCSTNIVYIQKEKKYFQAWGLNSTFHFILFFFDFLYLMYIYLVFT